MPMGAMSSSPGSIYPCLKNLEESGYVLAKVTGGSIKARKQFRISASGRRILNKWFSEPLAADSVIKSPAMLFIKLSFIDSDNDEISNLLLNLSRDLTERKKSLTGYKEASEHAMHSGGLLALDLSIQMIALLEHWSAEAAVITNKIN